MALDSLPVPGDGTVLADRLDEALDLRGRARRLSAGGARPGESERDRAYERERKPAQAVSFHVHPPFLGPRSRPAAGRWTGSGWAPPCCRREAPAQGSVFLKPARLHSTADAVAHHLVHGDPEDPGDLPCLRHLVVGEGSARRARRERRRRPWRRRDRAAAPPRPARTRSPAVAPARTGRLTAVAAASPSSSRARGERGDLVRPRPLAAGHDDPARRGLPGDAWRSSPGWWGSSTRRGGSPPPPSSSRSSRQLWAGGTATSSRSPWPSRRRAGSSAWCSPSRSTGRSSSAFRPRARLGSHLASSPSTIPRLPMSPSWRC